MLRARVGWKTVTLIVVFLFLRAIAATVLEVRVVGDGVLGFRLVTLVLWSLMLAGLAFGVELARFIVVMLLALGTALAVTILLDPQMMWYDEEHREVHWIRYYLMALIGSNLAVVPLLAFSKQVRSFFSRVPAMQGPIAGMERAGFQPAALPKPGLGMPRAASGLPRGHAPTKPLQRTREQEPQLRVVDDLEDEDER